MGCTPGPEAAVALSMAPFRMTHTRTQHYTFQTWCNFGVTPGEENIASCMIAWIPTNIQSQKCHAGLILPSPPPPTAQVRTQRLCITAWKHESDRNLSAYIGGGKAECGGKGNPGNGGNIFRIPASQWGSRVNRREAIFSLSTCVFVNVLSVELLQTRPMEP